MNQDIRNRIAFLEDSEISFEPNWTWTLYESVEDIIEANDWKSGEVVEILPKKIQTVFLLADLKQTINNDGFFSVFYNESFSDIKRLRRAMEVAGLHTAGELFDESLRLVQSKFQWTDENDNFVGQVGAQPYEFFGDEITDRIGTIESRLEDILFDDDFERQLETFWKS